MFKPFSGETRTRHAYLEAAQADLADNLSHPMFAGFIGENACDRLLGVLQSLVIPNINSSGLVTLPKRHDEEAIPYIAARHDEELILSTELTGPTPLQQERMLEAVADWGDDSPLVDPLVAKRAVQEITRLELPQSASNDNLGFVMYGSAGAGYRSPDSDKQWRGLFKGRPHLGLMMDKPFPRITLIHEAEHVRQILDQPVVFGDDAAREESAIRGELQSYHYAAHFAFLLRHAGIADLGEEFNNMVIIEAVRSQHASDEDPFKPTEEILETLRTLGLEDRVNTSEA